MLDLKEIVENLHLQVDHRLRPNLINVTRDLVLDGAFRALKRAIFDPRAPPSIKFVGEQAIDEGGPTREFFRLVIHDIGQMPIFQESRVGAGFDLVLNQNGEGSFLPHLFPT